jgi:hypothetical protein
VKAAVSALTIGECAGFLAGLPPWQPPRPQKLLLNFFVLKLKPSLKHNSLSTLAAFASASCCHHHNKELNPTMSALQSKLIRDPTSPEISDFLSTRSGCEMVQLLQSMQDPTAQAALTTALLFSPPVVTSRLTASDKISGKTKKALNAFVGFRCKFH